MKRIKFSILFICIALLTACSLEEPVQLTEADDVLRDEATQFVEAYKKEMIESVNKRSFNPVEPYLIKNTSFYLSLKQYIDDAAEKKMSKELELFEVDKVYVDELDDVYVDAREKVVIYEGEEEKHIERDEQFHLNRYNDTFRVVNIKINSTNETSE